MTIEIHQDFEYDGGDLGSRMNCFWSEGHDLDQRKFIEAVLEHLMEYEADIPAISWEDCPEEIWQRTVDHGQSLEYVRSSTPPKDEDWNKSSWRKVTLLDLERSRRGVMSCAVERCREPWFSGNPVRVVVSPSDGDPSLSNPTVDVRVWLCAKHQKAYPEPSYRVFMVPVGATIVLPKKDE